MWNESESSSYSESIQTHKIHKNWVKGRTSGALIAVRRVGLTRRYRVFAVLEDGYGL